MHNFSWQISMCENVLFFANPGDIFAIMSSVGRHLNISFGEILKTRMFSDLK